jgi:lysophospholipase L1-like esterase
MKGKDLVYKADYTIEKNGLRSGLVPVRLAAQPVMFLGDSFIFGQGVGDREAMPAVFEALSGGYFSSLNFGVPGYGLHQVLATLEHNLEKEVLGQKQPRAAVYLALEEHIQRANGLTIWDEKGPRYTLQEGIPVYTGSFDQFITNKIQFQLNKSRLFNRVVTPRLITPSDEDLFVAMVVRAKQIFEHRYNAPFIVLYWGAKTESRTLRITERLKEKNVEVIRIDDVLPSFKNSPHSPYVIPDDGHPNKLAHQLIARFLWEHLSGGNKKTGT